MIGRARTPAQYHLSGSFKVVAFQSSLFENSVGPELECQVERNSVGEDPYNLWNLTVRTSEWKSFACKV